MDHNQETSVSYEEIVDIEMVVLYQYNQFWGD